MNQILRAASSLQMKMCHRAWGIMMVQTSPVAPAQPAAVQGQCSQDKCMMWDAEEGACLETARAAAQLDKLHDLVDEERKNTMAEFIATLRPALQRLIGEQTQE